MRWLTSNQNPLASESWIVFVSVDETAAVYVAPVVMSLVSVVVRLVILPARPEAMFASPAPTVPASAVTSAALTV